MPLPTTILDRSFAGGTLAGGNNDSELFTLRSGHAKLTLIHVKSGLTSWLANLWMLADDGTTWTQVLDTAGAALSLFGTISASVTGKAYPIWLGGPVLPTGIPMKITCVVTGTPSGTDSIRIGLAQAA